MSTNASNIGAAQDAVAAINGFKNRLINGDFAINQRSFAGGALAAGVYGFDRWKAGSGGCNVSLTSGVLTHTSGPLVQVIETPNLAGKTITVSVEDPNGSVTVNVDGVTGTITAGAGRRGVSLAVPSGSTGNVTLTLTATGVTYKRVQLEVAGFATAWDQRHVAIEILLCSRYYQRPGDEGVRSRAATGQGVSSTGYFCYVFPRMRAAPALTIGTGSTMVRTAIAYPAAYSSGSTITTTTSVLFRMDASTMPNADGQAVFFENRRDVGRGIELDAEL